MHRYSWRFLCAKHCADECLNGIRRLEMLKIMQREWPYWKLHPNPMTMGTDGKDRMLRIEDLLRSKVPSQRLKERYVSNAKAMRNMALSSALDIGHIALMEEMVDGTGRGGRISNEESVEREKEEAIEMLWNSKAHLFAPVTWTKYLR